MTNTALDAFGKWLIREVRDEVIQFVDNIYSKRAKDGTAAAVREFTASWDSDQIEAFQALAPMIVDTTLADLLWALQESKSIRVSVSTNESNVPSIKEISDGLLGELYTKDGWVGRFSKFPRDHFVDPDRVEE